MIALEINFEKWVKQRREILKYMMDGGYMNQTINESLEQQKERKQGYKAYLSH